MKFTLDILLKVPLETVWPFLGEEEKMKLWITELEEIVYPEGRDLNNPVVTKFKQRLREGGHTTWYEGEIISYQPQRKLGLRLFLFNKQFSVIVTYKLSATHDGTWLNYTADGETYMLFAKLMGFLFRPLIWSIIKRHMKNLKLLVEKE